MCRIRRSSGFLKILLVFLLISSFTLMALPAAAAEPGTETSGSQTPESPPANPVTDTSGTGSGTEGSDPADPVTDTPGTGGGTEGSDPADPVTDTTGTGSGTEGSDPADPVTDTTGTGSGTEGSDPADPVTDTTGTGGGTEGSDPADPVTDTTGTGSGTEGSDPADPVTDTTGTGSGTEGSDLADPVTDATGTEKSPQEDEIPPEDEQNKQTELEQTGSNPSDSQVIPVEPRTSEPTAVPVTAAAPRMLAAPRSLSTPIQPDPDAEKPVKGEDFGKAPGGVFIPQFGTAGGHYENDLEGNAIQNALKDALGYVSTLYEGPGASEEKRVTLIVEDGIYQGGLTIGKIEDEAPSPVQNSIVNLIDTILDLQERNPAPIYVDIVAQDTLDSEGNSTLSGAGNAELEGDLFVNFKNLNLMLSGIYFSTRGKITVEEVDSLTVKGTKRDDEFTVQAHAPDASIQVDTLEGDDRVEVTVDKKPIFQDEVTFGENTPDQIQQMEEAFQNIHSQAQIDGSQLPQTIKDELNRIYNSMRQLTSDDVNNQQALNILVDLGAGNDHLDLTLIDSTHVAQQLNIFEKPDTEQGILGRYGLNYQFKVDLGYVDAQIQGGDGNDRLNVQGQMAPPADQVTPGAHF